MTMHIKIGTRGSPLALTQARMVAKALEEASGCTTEIVEIRTSGDWSPAQGEVRLDALKGGKGLFAKEIQQSLVDGVVDCAVHSMKDMDSIEHPDLEIAGMLPREDVCDVLILRKEFVPEVITANPLDCLPDGAVVGTSSVRRQAFLLSMRPALKIVPFRGNVGTRLEKLERGDVDATLLARAGLNRLRIGVPNGFDLDPKIFVPSAAQGAVGIEIRKDRGDMRTVIGQISHEETFLCASAERAVLETIDGSCHTPIGVRAIHKGVQMHIEACLLSLDGRQKIEDFIIGDVQILSQAEALGRALGQRLLSDAPHDLFEQKVVG